jgi:hypothetical protein
MPEECASVECSAEIADRMGLPTCAYAVCADKESAVGENYLL